MYRHHRHRRPLGHSGRGSLVVFDVITTAAIALAIIGLAYFMVASRHFFGIFVAGVVAMFAAHWWGRMRTQAESAAPTSNLMSSLRDVALAIARSRPSRNRGRAKSAEDKKQAGHSSSGASGPGTRPETAPAGSQPVGGNGKLNGKAGVPA